MKTALQMCKLQKDRASSDGLTWSDVVYVEYNKVIEDIEDNILSYAKNGSDIQIDFPLYKYKLAPCNHYRLIKELRDEGYLVQEIADKIRIQWYGCGL